MDLIETKLHVAYAKTYQNTTGHNEYVTAEIDKAEWYLKEAKGQVNRPTEDELDAIGRQLEETSADLRQKGFAADARYEKIKAERRDMLRKM